MALKADSLHNGVGYLLDAHFLFFPNYIDCGFGVGRGQRLGGITYRRG
jgi:hypothetical protein